MGYTLHLYSNKHLIHNKTHAHKVKEKESVDCTFDFKGYVRGGAENELAPNRLICEHPNQYIRLVQI
jgi:hypothetical protein